MESTVNRVGDRVFEQLDRTGHAHRLDDLDRIAALGATTVRYPVLWERTAPDGLDQADWRWPDERLGRLQALNIAPIVGLVHHGSGPRSTSLIDPEFPEKLAQYARAVAERYPWVDSYTPVNEPLTTARFSGLYGHWYPHGRDERTFARVLVTQCRAVVLAMRAIREVNPQAQLVQTDDLGKTFSTGTLQYQAAFDNERRWLSWDLLCGRVTPAHPLWRYLCRLGIEEELWWFVEHPCPPNLIGVDYYLSSERFLDERTDQYPPDTHGGNSRHWYADVLAARVRIAGIVGPGALLREAWERYRIPVALTEAHNGCTREEQLRWLVDVWQAANDARRDGADVRAVTAWALFGAYDWNSLVTRDDGHYEPGVWDVRGPTPRPTAIVGLLQDLAAGREPDHPVLGTPGWWQQPTRFIYGVAIDDTAVEAPRVPLPRTTSAARTTTRAPRPLVITGATGTLGQAFARLCELRGLPYRLLSRQEMDITEGRGVTAGLRDLNPWAVVNTAGYVRVDAAERDVDTCMRANAEGPAVLAAACAERGVPLLTFSSNLVFDGRKTMPYVESDLVAPLNVYGRSKALAEAQVLHTLPSALVVRTSAFFGPWDQHNFVTGVLRALAKNQRIVAADDVLVAPTYVPDLVHAALDLLIDGERGVWHLANDGAVTWADLGRRTAVLAGFDPAGVDAQPSAALGWTAPRPRYSVLGTARGQQLPSLDDALVRYLHACEHVSKPTI